MITGVSQIETCSHLSQTNSNISGMRTQDQFHLSSQVRNIWLPPRLSFCPRNKQISLLSQRVQTEITSSHTTSSIKNMFKFLRARANHPLMMKQMLQETRLPSSGEFPQTTENLTTILWTERRTSPVERRSLDGLTHSGGLTPELMTTKLFFRLAQSLDLKNLALTLQLIPVLETRWLWTWFNFTMMFKTWTLILVN